MADQNKPVETEEIRGKIREKLQAAAQVVESLDDSTLDAVAGGTVPPSSGNICGILCSIK